MDPSGSISRHIHAISDQCYFLSMPANLTPSLLSWSFLTQSHEDTEGA
jgi:hypothetical protein